MLPLAHCGTHFPPVRRSSSIGADLRRLNTIEVSLALFAYDESGPDVQVNAGIGGGYRIWRSVLPSTSYRPMLKDNWPTETGHVTVLSTVAVTPELTSWGCS